MKKIVIYEAEDGVKFETFEECEAYEKMLHSPLVMYQWSGDPTSDVGKAAVIYLGDVNESLGQMFLDLANKQHEVATGIDEDSWGWYFWDECADAYSWISMETLEVLGKHWDTVCETIVK